MKRKCDNCGDEYEAKRPTSKYCKQSCRVRASQKKEKSEKMLMGAQMKSILNTVLEAVSELKNIPKIVQAPVFNNGQPLERNDPNMQALSSEVGSYLDNMPEPKVKNKLDEFWEALKEADTKEWCLSLAAGCNSLSGVDWFKKKEFVNAANAKAQKLG